MNSEPVDILLVEDNRNDIELAIHAFKSNKLTAHFHVVRDGVEALEFLFRQGQYTSLSVVRLPKIILLDLKIPKIDGISVLQQIKRDPRTKTIPVIALTTSNEMADVNTAYESGINSYILKPVEFKEFADAIRLISDYWLRLNYSPRQQSI